MSGEAIDARTRRSAGVVGTARRKGGSGNRGRSVTGEGSGLNVATGGGSGKADDLAAWEEAIILAQAKFLLHIAAPEITRTFTNIVIRLQTVVPWPEELDLGNVAAVEPRARRTR